MPGLQFTHSANAQARIVVKNCLLINSFSKEKVLIPRCTYTDPEVASVGATERELKSGSVAYDVYARDLIENDRAICDDKKGLYRVYTKKGTDTILGASLVGGPAGDLIGLISTAMVNGIGL